MTLIHKKMKKVLVSLILVSLLSIPVLVLAQGQPGPVTAPGWFTYDVEDTLTNGVCVALCMELPSVVSLR